MTKTTKKKASKPKRASTKAGTGKKRASTKSDETGKKKAGKSKGAGKTSSKKKKFNVSLCIFESGKATQQRASKVATELGYKVGSEKTVDAINARITGHDPPDVVIVGVPGGEAIIEVVKQMAGERPVVIAAVAGPATTARARAEELEADLVTLRPHGTDGMTSVLMSASQVSCERSRVRALQGNEEILRERLQRYGQADVSTGFQHFDFFKRILIMELKRAKRYGYSLAACLIGMDPWAPGEPEPSPSASSKLRTKVAAAITSVVRDIDVPVDYAEDRILVFLPYTDIKGAERVGNRLAKAVRSHGTVKDGGRRFKLTVSVGIAAVPEGKPISFAKLMRDANAAVRAAQLKGGDRVVVRHQSESDA